MEKRRKTEEEIEARGRERNRPDSEVLQPVVISFKALPSVLYFSGG